MKFSLVPLFAVSMLLIGGCSSSEPDTLGVDSFASTDEPTDSGDSSATDGEASSTCDVAREALLTGSSDEVKLAMEALKADTSADATAREYADYYLHRDAKQPSLQEMDKSLIQSACTIGGGSADDADAPSTCDVAREALLTGSSEDIRKAMQALKVDKSADATAREYADYYLNRDARQPDLQEMDKSLIQSSCSL